MTDTQPEALRLAQELDAVPETGADPQTIQEAAAELRRLHAYCQELESHLILDCMTHVQKPSEIEHVADDVSKNGAELNMSTQQPAQAAPAAMHSDLRARCVEVLAWRETGTLPGEALRTLAREKYGDRYDAIQRAERDTENEALNLVAAAPTTQPAPQQEVQEPGWVLVPADSVTAPADGANWQDISTAPKDGTRFVAVGNNYGLYSETQHTCIAQWFRGCWMEVSEWNEDSELKYLTHWMPLPPLPGSAASATADSVTAPARVDTARKQGENHD